MIHLNIIIWNILYKDVEYMEKECIIFIIIIILILLLYRWIIQRKEAIDNVLQRTDEEKIKDNRY